MKMRPFKIHFRHNPNSPSFFKPSKTHIFLLTFVYSRVFINPFASQTFCSQHINQTKTLTHTQCFIRSLSQAECVEKKKGELDTETHRERDKDTEKENSNCENHHLILLCLIHLKIPNPNPKLSLNIKLMAHLTWGVPPRMPPRFSFNTDLTSSVNAT
jgi:hypothetical protein